MGKSIRGIQWKVSIEVFRIPWEEWKVVSEVAIAWAWWLIHSLNYLLCVVLWMFYYLMMVGQNEYVMLLLILMCIHDCVVKGLKSYWCSLMWVPELWSLVVLWVCWVLHRHLCVFLYCCAPYYWWNPLWSMISLHVASYGSSGNGMLTRCTTIRTCRIHTCKPRKVSSEEENSPYRETCAWWCVMAWVLPWIVYGGKIS